MFPVIPDISAKLTCGRSGFHELEEVADATVDASVPLLPLRAMISLVPEEN